MIRASITYLCMILLLFVVGTINAQYKGGIGDGLGGKNAIDTLGSNIGFAGGLHDGVDMVEAQDESNYSQFFGGTGDGGDLRYEVETALFGFGGGQGDGFDGRQTVNDDLLGFKGGNGDGADELAADSDALFGFAGGQGDGFSDEQHTEDRIAQFTGGTGDGTDMRKYLTKIWEGLVSRQWTDPDNWSDQKVPTEEDNVYVPNGKPRYPRLDDEVLVIGNASDPLALHALSLSIAGNATLHGIGSSVLYNYNTIHLVGTIDINSSEPSGFFNIGGAMLDLRPGAMMRVR